jgi:PAS domain S-box-containing protein
MSSDSAAIGSELDPLSGDALQTLRADSHFILYRDIRGDGSSVLVLGPAKPEWLPAEGHHPLEHEWALAPDLDSSWAVRPLALTRDGARTLLILEDDGGEPLSEYIGTAPLPIDRFLQLAINVATALRHVHAKGLIHGDIRPHNFWVNRATGAIRVLGFGFASKISREHPARSPPELLADALPYMAPEQTGRMSRSIDTRADLYALGVTLYEVLTGKLPFNVADPMEWIHCHLAREPAPPTDVRADIPACVSAIVMKLLAKAPEQRYQTAAALSEDLTRALREWDATGTIASFPLGTHDIPATLRLSGELYGRERELAVLNGTLERVVATGASGCILLSGSAGVGKSSLVQRLQEAIARFHGRFASGKCDQYESNVPYAPLARMFQSLINPLLDEPEPQLTAWRQSLLEAVGANAPLLTNLVPQLELLIGKQPALNDLPPHEALTRFQTVTRRVVAVFARAEHPLVVFLDDLQWMDSASAGIIEYLATAAELRHLLLIGAFRQEESSAARPLTKTLSVLRAANPRIIEIALKPLTLPAVTRLVCEAVHCDADRGQPLAQLVFQKTGGNPFFTLQFLAALCQEDLLKRNEDEGRWTWNLRRIRAKGHTENVLDFMAANLHRLPSATCEALQELACLGSRVGLATLRRLAQGEELAVVGVLESAVRAGYLVRVDSGYRFVHDRIREAAYSLILPKHRPAAHLRIGRLLGTRTPPEKLEAEIFVIVDQLNRGVDLVTDPAERERIARYNLTAGLRAKKTTGYESALQYFRIGRELLRADCWSAQYELAFSFELHAGHCEYATGALEVAAERLDRLAQRVANIGDQCQVACLRTNVYMTSNQSERAAETCLECLRSMGTDWPPHPGPDAVGQAFQRVWTQLGDRAVEDLMHLPLMSEPRALSEMSVLSELASIAGATDANLLGLVTGRIVNLTLAKGNSAAGAFGYCLFGVLLVARYRDYRKALRFGQLALALVKNRAFEPVRHRVHLVYVSISYWMEPIGTALRWFKESFEDASSQGDLAVATYIGQHLVTHRFIRGEPLAEVENELDAVLEFTRRARYGLMADMFTARRGFLRALRGLTRELDHFDHADFSEHALEEGLRANPQLTTVSFLYWVYKLQARYLAGHHAAALAAAEKAQAMLWAATGMPEVADYHFYDALARAASCEEAAEDQRQVHEEALLAHQSLLGEWARNCPENFKSRELLVAAEHARIRGRDADAMRLYESAARAAHEHRAVYVEALAHELAGRLCLRQEFETAAHAHLRNAHAAYVRWGAVAKAKQLERLDPALTMTESSTAEAADGSPVQQVDVMSVIRSSHALSSAVTLQELIESFMRIALVNAGANRGLLILQRGETHRIEAEASTRGTKLDVRLCDLPMEAPTCPESLLRHVIRTRKSFILADATEPDAFGGTTYDSRAKSILCVPIMKQARLSGLLYLENSLTTHAFTPDRVALLELIAGQAAISLENTRLYSDLQEREMRIRRLVDSNIIGIMYWELDGLVTEGNDAFLSLVGYSRQDLLSGHIDWKKLTPPEYQRADAAALRELQHDGTHAPFEKEYVCKQGHRVPVLVGGAFLHGSHDRGLSFVLDLTERRRTEAERHAHQVAEAANQAKSQFLATMSHELRTPLNGMLGYAQILARDQSLDERQRSAVQVIHSSGHQLLRLINDVLDLAKIEAGRFELTPVDIYLPEFLRSIADVIRVSAGQRGLELTCDWDENLPTQIQADEHSLRRVLLNLLANAVKFTDHGEVALQVRFSPPTGLRFQVRDTGIGIKKELLDSIFRPFCQVGEPHRRVGGTGLGLSISQQLVRSMGGELHVTSTFGQGTTFWFELSRVVTPQVERPKSIPASQVVTGYEGARRTVLVVDDVAYNRAMLIEWLQSVGFGTLEAANGREALEQAARHADLVLMDLVMPEVDGREAIESLRRNPETRALPIIATSASVSASGVRESHARGADAFLPKPIDLAQLQMLMGSLLKLTWTFASPAPSDAERDAADVLVAPPLAELDILYGLAQQGNMRDIARQAAHVALLDERYQPFARELQQLARTFQSKAILRLIERHRK